MSAAPELIFPTAVLLFPAQDGPLLVFARNVHDALLNNPAFASPTPPLPTFLANVNAYADAVQKAAARGKGTAKARNAKRKKVKTDLHHLRDFIQGVAEQAASPAEAAALITAVFLSIKKIGKVHKPELAARYTGIAGQVRLDAKAVAHQATYFWQYRVKQGDWVDVPETMKARTTIAGLTSAQTYDFRFRAVTRKGKVDWSQIVSLLVH